MVGGFAKDGVGVSEDTVLLFVTGATLDDKDRFALAFSMNMAGSANLTSQPDSLYCVSEILRHDFLSITLAV